MWQYRLDINQALLSQVFTLLYVCLHVRLLGQSRLVFARADITQLSVEQDQVNFDVLLVVRNLINLSKIFNSSGMALGSEKYIRKHLSIIVL